MIVGLLSTALFQYLKCQDQWISKNCRSTFIVSSSWNLWGGPIFAFSLPGGGGAHPCSPASYATGSRHIWVLFFAHIPFVVNHTINATPPERLQQHPLLFTTNRTDRTFFSCRLHLARPHILVTAPFCCDRKARAACAESFALWQQATIEIMRRNHSLFCLFSPRIYGCCSSRTSRSWLIAHSTQRQPRRCNSSRAVDRSRGVGRIFNLRSRQNFNDSDSGQTFCSPIVTVCAMNVRKRHTWQFSKPSPAKRRSENKSKFSAVLQWK